MDRDDSERLLAVSVYGPGHPDSVFYQEEVVDNTKYLAEPEAAAELQRFQRRKYTRVLRPRLRFRVNRLRLLPSSGSPIPNDFRECS